MRITGGVARGIRLEVPQQDVRPATDYMREYVFNRLANAVIGKNILDCFAGTGAYGLEAISRGAQSCYFLEKNPKVLTCLKANCERILKSAQRSPDTIKIISTDLFHFSPEIFSTIDYVFFDPPYPYWDDQFSKVLEILNVIARAYSKSLFIIEHPTQLQWPVDHLLQPLDPLESSKKKNAPSVHFFRIKEEHF